MYQFSSNLGDDKIVLGRTNARGKRDLWFQRSNPVSSAPQSPVYNMNNNIPNCFWSYNHYL